MRGDPLSPDERKRLMTVERPRNLPLAPHAAPAKRRLPLAASSRPQDVEARPIYAVWEITLACDLSCRHCGSRAGRARPDELSTAECIDLVHQMAALGVREVTLIGGEAYLHAGWLDILTAIGQQGMTATMTTGGRGITAERAVQAKQAGLISASVSIDGIAETHDRLRGVQGSFASALAALKHLRNAGVQVSVNTQINRLSMPQLFDVLDILAEHQAHAWQLQLTVPMGRATDEPEVLLQPQDLLSLFPLLAELKERANQLGVRIFPGNNIGYFGPHESKLRDFMVRKHSSSCMAGQLTLGIEADGSIKGCPSLPTENWVGGNVRDASLRDIWERSTPLRYTRDRSVDDLWGYCRDCYYADVCLAGCTWTSDVFFGRPGNNPYCHHRALEFDKRGLRERLVRTATAPGQPFDQGGFEIIIESATGADAPSQQGVEHGATETV